MIGRLKALSTEIFFKDKCLVAICKMNNPDSYRESAEIFANAITSPKHIGLACC